MIITAWPNYGDLNISAQGIAFWTSSKYSDRVSKEAIVIDSIKASWFHWETHVSVSAGIYNGSQRPALYKISDMLAKVSVPYTIKRILNFYLYNILKIFLLGCLVLLQLTHL